MLYFISKSCCVFQKKFNEAKGTNGGKIQAYGWTLKRSSNKRGDVFGWVCVICVAWEV